MRGKIRVYLFGIFIIVYFLASSKIYIAHLHFMVTIHGRLMLCSLFKNAFDPCSTLARLWLPHMPAHAYENRKKFSFFYIIFFQVQKSEHLRLVF